MKKKMFRERNSTFVVDEPTEELVKELIEKEKKRFKEHLEETKKILTNGKAGVIEVIRPAIEVEEKPKKRGRKKSVK